jgi:hypothetical protein
MTNGEQWAIDHPELRKVSGASRAANFAQPTPRKPRPAPLPLRAPERAGDVIVLPMHLPHRVLHKNGRTKNQNWKASLVEAAKNAAYFATLAVRPDIAWQAVRIDATFWTQNRLDDDGAWSWLVAYRDGIAAALKVNDRDFTCGTIAQHTGVKSGGRREVELTITRLA